MFETVREQYAKHGEKKEYQVEEERIESDLHLIDPEEYEKRQNIKYKLKKE
mgnify:FL=1